MLPYNVENDILPIICKARGGLLEVHNGAAAAAAEQFHTAGILAGGLLMVCCQA
jgi:hypothetical protein